MRINRRRGVQIRLINIFVFLVIIAPTYVFADMRAQYDLEMGNASRARLDEFYNSRTLHPGLGELILRGESMRFGGQKPDEFYRLHAARYVKLVKEVRRIWQRSAGVDTLVRLDEIRAFLNPYYRHYALKVPGLSALLQPSGYGNCVANSQLILAVLIDAGVEVGPKYALGVQLFINHLQPVLYEPATGVLIDLTSGNLAKHDAPVYSPELITFAIARSAGRAMPSEREFGLKILDADFFKMDASAATRYFIFDQREQEPSAWGDPEYLLFDQGVSYFAGGAPPPLRAEIEFSSIADASRLRPQHGYESYRAPGGYGGAGKAAARGSNSASSPDEELSFDPFKGDDVRRLIEAHWQYFQPERRPNPTLQTVRTRAALDQVSEPVPHYELRVQSNLRPARLEELDQIPDDLNFAVVAQPPGGEETLRLKAGQVQLKYPKLQLLIRPQFAADPWLSDAGDSGEVAMWLNQSFAQAASDRSRKIDLSDYARWTIGRESLTGANEEELQALLKNVRAYADLNKLSTDLAFVGYFVNWQQLPSSAESCTVLNNMQRLALSVAQDPDGWLKWLNALDPDSRLLVFKSFLLWKELLPTLTTAGCLLTSPVALRRSLNLADPLAPIFDLIVAKTLSTDDVELLRPETSVQVELMPSFENSKPAKIKAAPVTRTGAATESKEVKDVAVRNDRFAVRTETLFGLFSTVSTATVSSPTAQLAMAKLWSPLGQNYFKKVWSAIVGVRNFVAVWSWSPFLSESKWMTPLMGEILKRVDSVAGEFAIVGERPVSAVTRVPDYLVADLKRAAPYQLRGIPDKLTEIKTADNAFRGMGCFYVAKYDESSRLHIDWQGRSLCIMISDPVPYEAMHVHKFVGIDQDYRIEPGETPGTLKVFTKGY